MNFSLTVIDVGWGDSLFLETVDAAGARRFALIDSNDTTADRSSAIYLRKYFDRLGEEVTARKPLFDFVMLSHDHTDHGQGLKALMQQFGTKYFFYSKTASPGVLASLISFANRSKNVAHHQSIDDSKIMPAFGDVAIDVLWPRYDAPPSDDENNNSIVMTMTLGDVSFLLAGDAEAEVWREIAPAIPANTRVVKVPHHGSINGSLDGYLGAWTGHCPTCANLAISSHVRPFRHPSPEVVELFAREGRPVFRTDLHYHLTFTTDGENVTVKYSH